MKKYHLLILLLGLFTVSVNAQTLNLNNNTVTVNSTGTINIPSGQEYQIGGVNIGYESFGCAVDSSLEVTTQKWNCGYTMKAITIDTIIYTITRTGGNTPSVTPKLFFGTDIDAAGTAVVTSPSAVTSYTTVTKVSTFNNASVPTGNSIWLTFSAVTTKSRNFSVQIIYH